MSIRYHNLKVNSDSRGFVFEPLPADAFSYQKNAHVVVSDPGVIRGNHFHIKGEERIAVVGPSLVRYRENDEIKEIDIPSGEVYGFTFPPGVGHAIKNMSDRPNVLVAFNTVKHDPDKPDTIEDLLL
jgi:UDP-2-acetamido-2,6-beta-L-arabino-hexul-4-ose reductase